MFAALVQKNHTGTNDLQDDRPPALEITDRYTVVTILILEVVINHAAATRRNPSCTITTALGS